LISCDTFYWNLVTHLRKDTMALLSWFAWERGERTICLTDFTDWYQSFLHSFSWILCESGWPWCGEVLEETSIKPDHPLLGHAEGKGAEAATQVLTLCAPNSLFCPNSSAPHRLPQLWPSACTSQSPKNMPSPTSKLLHGNLHIVPQLPLGTASTQSHPVLQAAKTPWDLGQH